MDQDRDWRIESDPAGPGRIRHLAAPGFTALWATGDEALAAIEAPCWSVPGSGGEGCHPYPFALRWDGPAPGQESFARLMEQAATAIDQWIAARL